MKKLGLCEGDCDTDNDCVNDLVCYQRDGFSKVPSCEGNGKKDLDYCIEDTFTLRGVVIVILNVKMVSYTFDAIMEYLLFQAALVMVYMILIIVSKIGGGNG